MFFYHIWEWRPSWSCDPAGVNKILFPLYKETSHKNLALNDPAVSEKMFEQFEQKCRQTDGCKTKGIL